MEPLPDDPSLELRGGYYSCDFSSQVRDADVLSTDEVQLIETIPKLSEEHKSSRSARLASVHHVTRHQRVDPSR